MRDFVSAFAQGLAGANRGFVVGYELGEKTQERKRKTAEDAATAAWRTSQAAETGRHNRAVEGTSAGNAAETRRHNRASEATSALSAATGARNATTAEQNAVGLKEYRQSVISGKGAENTAKFMELARKMGWNAGLEASLEQSIKGYKAKTWQEFLNLSAADMGTAPPALEDPNAMGDAGATGYEPPPPPEEGKGYAFGGVVRPAVGALSPQVTQSRVGRFQNNRSAPAAIAPRVGRFQGQPLQGYQDGGLVEDKRETIIAKAPPEPLPTTALGSPKTPSGKLRIAKDQSRLGGELSETLRSVMTAKQRADLAQGLNLGIQAMAEEAQAPAPAAGPAPAPAPSPGGALAAGKTSMGGPDQAGQVQSAFKNEPALSTEEWEASLKKVDPEGKLPEQRQEIEVLARSMEYFTKAGMPEEAKKFAKSLLDRSRLIAATYGGAAEAAVQKGEYADAVQMLTEGWNNHVPDGSSLIVSKNGLVVLRDADGKVQAEFEPTAENIMAGALGLKDGSAWFEAVTRTAGEALTPAQEAKAADAGPKSDQLNSRLKLDKMFRGKPEEAGGEPGSDLIATALQPSFASSGVDVGDADTAKRVKPVREAVQHVATELVMGSEGALAPEAAAAVAAKLTAVDPENPAASPFQVRLNRDKKTKKPTTLDLLVDGEVYSLPHQSLPQVKKIIQFQQEQATLLANKLSEAKAAADTQAATDAERAAAAQQRNEGFKAAADTAVTAGREVAGKVGEQFSRLPETVRNFSYVPSMPDISGAAGWLKRQIPTTEGKKLNQRP